MILFLILASIFAEKKLKHWTLEVSFESKSMCILIRKWKFEIVLPQEFLHWIFCQFLPTCHLFFLSKFSEPFYIRQFLPTKFSEKKIIFFKMNEILKKRKLTICVTMKWTKIHRFISTFFVRLALFLFPF